MKSTEKKVKEAFARASAAEIDHSNDITRAEAAEAKLSTEIESVDDAEKKEAETYLARAQAEAERKWLEKTLLEHQMLSTRVEEVTRGYAGEVSHFEGRGFKHGWRKALELSATSLDMLIPYEFADILPYATDDEAEPSTTCVKKERFSIKK